MVGEGRGGAVGSQKVYVTQDIRDKSPEAGVSFTHTHKEAARTVHANCSSVLLFINSTLPWFLRADVIVMVNLLVTTACFCSTTHAHMHSQKKKKTDLVRLNFLQSSAFVVQLSTTIHQNQPTLIISGNTISLQPGLQCMYPASVAISIKPRHGKSSNLAC